MYLIYTCYIIAACFLALAAIFFFGSRRKHEAQKIALVNATGAIGILLGFRN